MRDTRHSFTISTKMLNNVQDGQEEQTIFQVVYKSFSFLSCLITDILLQVVTDLMEEREHLRLSILCLFVCKSI